MSESKNNTRNTNERSTENSSKRQTGASTGNTSPEAVALLDEFNDVQCLHSFFYDAIEAIFKELADDLPQGATTHYGFMLLKRYMLGRDQALKEHLADLHGGNQ